MSLSWPGLIGRSTGVRDAGRLLLGLSLPPVQSGPSGGVSGEGQARTDQGLSCVGEESGDGVSVHSRH